MSFFSHFFAERKKRGSSLFFPDERKKNKKNRRLDGGKSVELVHAFGRELPELRASSAGSCQPPFDLAVHCGGCLIDSQAMRARLRELRAAAGDVFAERLAHAGGVVSPTRLQLAVGWAALRGTF